MRGSQSGVEVCLRQQQQCSLSHAAALLLGQKADTVSSVMSQPACSSCMPSAATMQLLSLAQATGVLLKPSPPTRHTTRLCSNTATTACHAPSCLQVSQQGAAAGQAPGPQQIPVQGPASQVSAATCMAQLELRRAELCKQQGQQQQQQQQ